MLFPVVAIVIFAILAVLSWKLLESDPGRSSVLIIFGMISIFLGLITTIVISASVKKEITTEKIEVSMLKTATGTDVLFKDGDDYKNINQVKFNQTILSGDKILVEKTTSRAPKNIWLLPITSVTYTLVVPETRE
jgi:hypothetical protein